MKKGPDLMMEVKDNKVGQEKKEKSTTTNHAKLSTKRKASATSKIKELKSEVANLTNELNELKDKYLRVVAEFDNYKKRKEREISDIIERASEDFFLALLPVIDDFERSLNSESKRRSYKSLKQGIELIYQKLISVLKEQGVEVIEAIGTQFDPELHEAIMQVEDEEKPSNVVVNEALKGYRLKDRVLRYSQVIVNK